MKPSNSSIVTEGSIDSSSKKIDRINQNEDVSPPASPARKLRSTWTHNPAVLSMIACSTMQSCDDVKEVYRECVANNDNDSMMCEAAEKYYKMCHMKNGGSTLSGILDFTPYQDTP